MLAINNGPNNYLEKCSYSMNTILIAVDGVF